MERQHGLNNQLQSLFRSHPQMNAGYLGWHPYSADISKNQTCPADLKKDNLRFNLPRKE